MEEGLKNLQLSLLEMLLEFQKFTKEHQLEFFLVGGSALGAYRHKGFIPWDDDVDIAMMRSDFEKMEQFMRQQKNKLGDYLYSPVEAHLMPDAPIGYLYDATHLNKGYACTAKIDIHPIDGVPENKFLRKMQKMFSILYYLSEYRLPVKNKGKTVRMISKVILKITPNAVFRFYMKIGKRFITKWDDRISKNICSLFGVAGYEQEIMPRTYLQPLQKMEFEQCEFLVPGDIDPYLKRLYGNYMELPPKEDRFPRHTIYKNYCSQPH